MFYLVLKDGAGYRGGEVLDLGDPEVAAQIGRLVGLRPISAEEAAERTKPAPVPVAAPEPEPEPEPIAEPVVEAEPANAPEPPKLHKRRGAR